MFFLILNTFGKENNLNQITIKKQIIYLLSCFFSIVTFAQNNGKRTENFNLEKKVALQGYDPVAYFKQGKAVKAKKELATSYEGVIYNFSSATNKETFLKNPSGYEPQYGGWCAYAMGASGEKVEINPEHSRLSMGNCISFITLFLTIL